MAIVVEDGTGLSNANSYVSVAFADQYWADRGSDDWALLTTAKKEAALISATEYIDLRWGSRLAGRPAWSQQALQFPRIAFCIAAPEPGDVIPLPPQLLAATAQYALIASEKPLAPNPEMDSTGRYGTLWREKVGPIEEERRWGVGNTTPNMWPMYPTADALMQQLLQFGWQGGRVIR